MPPEEADKSRTATRYPAEVAEQLLRRIASMESATYQDIVSKAALKEAKKIILFLGHDRFGPPDAETTAAIESIKDMERLEQRGHRLLVASSLHELLAGP